MIYRKYKCHGCGKYFRTPTESHTCDECAIAIRDFAENLVLKPEDILKTHYGITFKKSKAKQANSFLL
jgi:hypothetical protein